MHTMTLHAALLQAQAVLVVFGGCFTWRAGGVEVYVNQATEEMWVEVEPQFEKTAWKAVMKLVLEAGWEFMDEEEAIEERPDGKVRHWLAVAPRLTCKEMSSQEWQQEL